MLDLSQETERLARRLAERQSLPVDVAVRQALERQAQSVAIGNGGARVPVSDEEIARRLALIEDITRQMDALPILDPRSPEEIMDEINEL